MARALGEKMATIIAEAETRAGLWDRVVGQDDPPGHEIFRHCLGTVADGHIFSLRQCLERQHDSLMGDLTLRFWKAGLGS